MRAVPDLVASTAIRSPVTPCAVQAESGRSLSFGRVHERAARLVTAFRQHGVDEGDRVALIARNEVEFFELQVACQRTGAILTPLNHRLAVPELRALLEDCTPSLLVVGHRVDAPGQATPHTWSLPADGPGDHYEEVLTAHAPETARRPLPAEDICVLLYTSGTTGRPRGVCISNRAIFSRACSYIAELSITADDVFLQPMPLFHISAHVSLGFTHQGAANVVVRDFDAASVATAVERHGVTQMLLVPTTIRHMCEADTPPAQVRSLRRLSYGGAAISADLVQRASALFGCELVQFYGMTELGAATVLRAADHLRPELLTAAGTEDLCSEVTILADDGTPLPSGAQGEIAARGPSAMSAYWGETAPHEEEDGWIRTGDLGYRDADGYVFVVDRRKDVIVSGGENVASRQVEEVLETHPDVAEVAVIGRADPEWGQTVHAVVRLSPGAMVTLEDLQVHARAHLAGFKLPRGLTIVDEFPRTAAGKVRKPELRSRYG